MDYYYINIQFELNDTSVFEMNPSELSKLCNKLKYDIFDKTYENLDVENELEIHPTFLNNYKDVSFDDIIIKDSDKFVIYDEYLSSKNMKPFKKKKTMYFRVVLKKNSMKQKIEEIFKDYCSKHKSRIKSYTLDIFDEFKTRIQDQFSTKIFIK